MTSIVPSLRVLLWGMGGRFTYEVLRALVAADMPPLGVVFPAQRGAFWRAEPRPAAPTSDLPLLSSFVAIGAAELAWESNIPVYRADSRHPSTLNAVHQLSPTVHLVACWQDRFTASLLSTAPWGGLNLHPSRLPEFRGPVPLFWQRRAGLTEGAVTLHTMTEEWDAGTILAQATVDFPDGATMDTLDSITGSGSGTLVANTLLRLANGAVLPLQTQGAGSYQSFPTDNDFVVPVSWTARRAWNFMRAAEVFQTPFTIEILSGWVETWKAVAYNTDSLASTSIIPTVEGLAIPFAVGSLIVSNGPYYPYPLK